MDGEVYVLGQHCCSIEEARVAVASLYWSTYRRGIPELSLSTDAGWGCMIRTAQMMLAHAWQRFRMSEKISQDVSATGTLFPKNEDELSERARNVFLEISWRFADLPADFSCFSIHHILQTAQQLVNMGPGEWFGPHTICSVLSSIVNQAATSHAWKLRMSVATDSMIFCDQLDDLCSRSDEKQSQNDSGNWDHSLILTVPLRLGVEQVERAKLQVLMAMLKLPQCIGFIGGTPRHSLYVIGQQPNTENLLYLDPHTTQDTLSDEHTASSELKNDKNGQYIDADNVPFPALPEWYLESVKAPQPYSMHATYLDPCLAIGFFLYDKSSLEDLRREVDKIFTTLDEPLLQILDKTPSYMSSKAERCKRDVRLSLDGEFSEDELNSGYEHHGRKLSRLSNSSWEKCEHEDAKESGDDEFVLL
eukprot:gb/GECG01015640.1/.p1 GENE.gb/GECG01015640.1/~~gb/GECG01015640.1/.p1  ORF type:complete len:419 (+),score=48.80 gb/GECG01015640.1/:1-1257(+)